MMLGNRIKELRQQKLLSQEKIAEELGVSRQAVSKWETGLSYPDTENLIALSKVLEVSVDELIQIKKEEQSSLEDKQKENLDNKRNRKPIYPTLFVVCLFVLLVVFGGTALILGYKVRLKGEGNNKVIETGNNLITLSTDSPNATDYQNATELPEATQTSEDTKISEDYLNSPDSLQLQEVTQSFAKAYFSGDLEGVKRYLADAEAAEVYEKNIFDNLEYMTLKWSPEDLATKTTIGVQYQFQEKGGDTATYLGMELMKITDKWKITSFYLEK